MAITESIKMEHMEQKIYIVQDSWNEEDDQELHEYLTNSNIQYKMLDHEAILTNINPSETGLMFCDTDLMQKLLRKYDVYDEIETYPKCLSEFYKRDIFVIRPKDLLDIISYPYFVKPITNNKSFNGTLIRSDMDREYVMSQIPDHLEQIYYCREIKPVNEYRIFVVDYKMFGIVDCSDFLIDEPIRKSITPPAQYIDNILKHNTYSHCVIDVAMDLSENFWYVIEVNPPFSLMSYGFPIDRYVQFCGLAWRSYVDKIKQ